LLARLGTLECRLSCLESLEGRVLVLQNRLEILEAERASRQQPRMVYNWHLREPELPKYEYYVDPAMRMTRNGN
jgi:hypothetical protein